MPKNTVRGKTRYVPAKNGRLSPFVALALRLRGIQLRTSILRSGTATLDAGDGEKPQDLDEFSLHVHTTEMERDKIEATIYLRTLEDCDEILHLVSQARSLLVLNGVTRTRELVAEGGAK